MRNSKEQVLITEKHVWDNDVLPHIREHYDGIVAGVDEAVEAVKGDDEKLRNLVIEGMTYSTFLPGVMIAFGYSCQAWTGFLAGQGNSTDLAKGLLEGVLEEVHHQAVVSKRLAECLGVIANAAGLLPELPYNDDGSFNYDAFTAQLIDAGSPSPGELTDQITQKLFELTA